MIAAVYALAALGLLFLVWACLITGSDEDDRAGRG